MSRWREIVSGSLLMMSALLIVFAMVAQVGLGGNPDQMGIAHYVVMPGIGLITFAVGGICCLLVFLLAPKASKYAVGVLLLSGLPLICWPALLYQSAVQVAKEQEEVEKLKIVREMVNGPNEVVVLQVPTNAAWHPVQMNLTNDIRR